MAYKSFRDFLTDIKRWGELKEISGAHWDLEMSTIAEIAYREGKRPVPAFLFDEIPLNPSFHHSVVAFNPSELSASVRHVWNRRFYKSEVFFTT